MYPSNFAKENSNRPVFIMATTGESVSYQEYESRCNQLAHFFLHEGLKFLDHYSIFMENNNRYLECCGAGERSGLYYTAINSYLKEDELAYILNNSESKILITSSTKLPIVEKALRNCPKIQKCLVINNGGSGRRVINFEETVSSFPTYPIDEELLGISMLYSSGTTGRPKGILRPLKKESPCNPLPLFNFLNELWQYRENMIYLSPAPLYHSAPQVAAGLVIRIGGTIVIMENFDAREYLALVDKHKITHSQLVPSMFSRMLKLPQEIKANYDLSSLEYVTHAAAPCPIPIKEQMIEWWGPIIHEYYSATEGMGFTALNSEEWIQNKGSVGKVILGDLHVLDENGNPSPPGQPGKIWFKTAAPFSYFNDEEKTREATSDDGTMSTVGDMGFIKNDYLYLTDRDTFMIISGGVNIYPQETENLLITHPKVIDAAVFGVPNEDLGEEVKAVVQVVEGVNINDELVNELLDFCMKNLSHQKCPRSIDFEDELPRLPTGKLYKRVLKDRYWTGHDTKIL